MIRRNSILEKNEFIGFRLKRILNSWAPDQNWGPESDFHDGRHGSRGENRPDNVLGRSQWPLPHPGPCPLVFSLAGRKENILRPPTLEGFGRPAGLPATNIPGSSKANAR